MTLYMPIILGLECSILYRMTHIPYKIMNDSYSLQNYQEACGEASDAEFYCVINYPRGIYVLEQLHTTAQLVYQLLIGTLWLIIMQQLVR